MRTHLTIAVLSALSVLSLHGQDTSASPLYIIPVTADGSVRMNGDDFVDKILMTETDDRYSASNVHLDNGMYFFGQSTDGNKSVYYSITGWVEKTPVMNLPNPLGITTINPGNQIMLAPGDYDIEFFSRDAYGSGYHLFTVTDHNTPSKPSYPSHLFLVEPDGKYTTLTNDKGVFYTTMVIPPEFCLSYEPRYNIPFFCYKPISDEASVLNLDVKSIIDYDSDNESIFTNSITDPVNILVDLRGTPHTIEISHAPIDAIESISDHNSSPIVIYGIDGSINETNDIDRLSPGLYIIKQGQQVKKLFVR